MGTAVARIVASIAMSPVVTKSAIRMGRVRSRSLRREKSLRVQAVRVLRHSLVLSSTGFQFRCFPHRKCWSELYCNVSGLCHHLLMTTSDPRLRELDDAFVALRAAEARVALATAAVTPELATEHGFTSVSTLVASIGRITPSAAARLCRLGSATIPRVSLTGERMPALFPIVGASLTALSSESALVIIGALSSVSPRARVDHLDAAEHALVTFALEHPTDSLRTLARQWAEALDPDGPEPFELPDRRFLRRSLLASGMKRYVLELDPVGAAFLDAAIDASVGSAIRFTSSPEPQVPIAHLAADAVVDLARHGIACDSPSVPLPSATVVVRMTLDSLLSGSGSATIDGSTVPVSASAARILAADAHIIPAVLGSNSEVLDWGMSRRLFSRSQRLALAERDDGCAWPDCGRPPSYTEAHHIRWWSRGGPTDLSNGVLLCSRHHHIVHGSGWEIEVRGNVPWFTPPPSVDPSRTPRCGGRLPAVVFA